MNEKLIIAHRGDTASAAENTIESFRSAALHGADMIECDVRRTKDGELILCHYDHIDNLPIQGLTWNDILKMNGKTGKEIPKLEDAVKSVAKKIKLDIELKESGYEDEVIGIVKKYFNPDDFLISSFNASSVKAVKRSHPEVKAGLIIGMESAKKLSAVKLAKLLSLRNIEIGAADFFVSHWSLVGLGFLRRVKKSGKPLFVWTVNSESMLRRFLRNDLVQGIITDRLEAAVALKKSLAK